MNGDTITKIFCNVDGFCSALEACCASRLLSTDAAAAVWFPTGRMSLNGVMTIAILFHLSGYRCFKWFYRRAVQGPLLQHYFPRTVRYSRFAELTEYSLMPLAVYTRYFRREKGTGISFIGSTPLKVCHNRRDLQPYSIFRLCGTGEKLIRLVLRVQTSPDYQ